MTPTRAKLVAVLLWVGCFCLALWLDPSVEQQRARSDRSQGVLAMLLGDGRRMFANHFFVKADAYFHRGVYPGIFDQRREEELHMLTAGHGENGEHDEHEHADGEDDEHGQADEDEHEHGHGFDEEPMQGWDWIAWLNGRLKPTEHVHLSGREAREMLPWLKLALELEPTNLQAYLTTAYWLRARLNKPNEAEQLLRDGLRHNPGDPALLLELGLVVLDGRQDSGRARNILEMAWASWQRMELPKAEPDYLTGEGILVRLAMIGEQSGQLADAVAWLRELRKLSPNPEAIAGRIQALEQELGTEGAGTGPEISPGRE